MCSAPRQVYGASTIRTRITMGNSQGAVAGFGNAASMREKAGGGRNLRAETSESGDRSHAEHSGVCKVSCVAYERPTTTRATQKDGPGTSVGES